MYFQTKNNLGLVLKNRRLTYPLAKLFVSPPIIGGFMKKSVLVASASIFVAASAYAADVYAPATGGYKDGPFVVPGTWVGFYTGLNGGYAFSNDNTIYYSGKGQTDSAYKTNTQGGFGGTYGGYNWQAGPFVYGIEADLQSGEIAGRTAGTRHHSRPTRL